MKILSIGSSILDHICFVDSLPTKNDVQVKVDRVELGGSAANVAVALAQLGLDTSVFCTVGTDADATIIRQSLINKGVDVSTVRSMSGPSGTCTCFVDANAQRSFVHHDGVNLTMEEDTITIDLIQHYDAIVISGYELVSPRSSKAVLHAVRIAANLGRRVYFDPAPVIMDIPLRVMDEVLRQSDYVVLNKDEATAFGKNPDIKQSVERLWARGATNVIVKLGPDGALFMNQSKQCYSPAFTTNAIDTNGAGDAFLAGFIAAQSRGLNEGQAMTFANAVASVIVQTIGAQSSDLSMAMIDELLRIREEQRIGSLIGLTIGDALGMPTSMMTHDEIQSTYGWITGFVLPRKDNPIHAHLTTGESTDDTALALMIVDEMIAHGGQISAVRLAKRLVDWANETNVLDSSILGPSSRIAIQQLKDGQDPRETGRLGVTNGGAMKVPPIGLIHSGNEQALIQHVVEACLPSHNTTPAMSGAMAIAFAVAAAMRQESLDQLVQASIRGATIGQSFGTVVDGPSVASQIQRAMALIDAKKTPLENAKHIASIIGSSMATEESVPMALVYAYLAKGNPKEAILLAVNMGDDADTIASMTGAITGAIQGVSSFPKEWVTAALNNSTNDLQRRLDALQELEVAWDKS